MPKKSTHYQNWLGRQGLQLIGTLTQEKQELCRSGHCLFETLESTLGHNVMKLFWHCNITTLVGIVTIVQNKGEEIENNDSRIYIQRLDRYLKNNSLIV